MNQTTTRSGQDRSLDTIETGISVHIKDLVGTREFISRASGAGFTPGVYLQVVQNFYVGPVIVYLRNTLIALSRSEARKIIIKGVET